MDATENAVKTTVQEIRQIAIADMEPESGYQRASNLAQVQNIVDKFDETRLGTLTVSERDGKYHVIDGAHRAKALRRLGYTHAPCVVLTGLTFEQEAEYFRIQNEDRRPVKPMEFFKAGFLSGDELCLSIYQTVRANNFKIGTSSKDFHKIGAVQALFTITEEYGIMTLDLTLRLISKTWRNVIRASQSESLLGVAEFVSRYGTADFAERMAGKFTAVYLDYIEAVHTRAHASSSVARKKFCRAIVTHYNRGLTASTGRRLTWES